MNRRAPTRDELWQKYVIEKKPMAKVAAELGVAVGTVYNYIKRYGIESRDKNDHPTTDAERERWREIGKRRKGQKHTDATKKKISKGHQNGGIGHKKKRSDGYTSIYFPDHPMSNSDGYIMEHVLVMEALIGRHLTEEECVHHINEKRNDNRAENLKLMTKSEHMSYHSKKMWDEKKKEE